MSNQYTEGIELYKSNPELLKEWDYERNALIDPKSIARGSIKKYWWKCKYGHVWQATPLHRSRGSSCPFCSGRRAIQGVNDLKTVSPVIASEWALDLNGEKRPENYKSNSHIVVWWRCHSCNQIWKSRISHRFNGSGCPYCAGKKPIKGVNDLQHLFPNVASEWDSKRNGDLKPDDVTYGSSKKIWWKCSRGHEWKTAVFNRTTGLRDCPYCSNAKHTSFPEQAILFYLRSKYRDVINRYLLNGMEIDIYLPAKKIGIEYDGVYYHKKNKKKDTEKDFRLKREGIRVIRVREKGLPAISSSEVIIRDNISNNFGLDDCLKKLINAVNPSMKVDVDVRRDEIKILEMYFSERYNKSFGALKPELICEWHPTKNGELSPYSFAPYSTQKVWWKCESCNHEWQAMIGSRFQNKGCPVCGRRKAGKKHTENMIKNGTPSLSQRYPELAKEWCYEKNGDITPEKVTCGSNKKVWWRCTKCGSIWQARINARAYGQVCLKCKKEKSKL